MTELFRRIQIIIKIILHGDLVNGNLKHLRSMMAELQYIESHQDDMTKEEILKLILASKANTGMLHHIRHLLTSQNWRIINAEMHRAEIADAERRVREWLKRLRENISK